MRLTHRHADGGLYSYQGPQEGKHPDTGDWVEGICYKSDKGKMYWTDKVRWSKRFTELGDPQVIADEDIHIEHDGGVASYYFSLDRVDDVIHMFITASQLAGKRRDGHLEAVLKAQAEMIVKGLHLREVEDIPDMMGDIVSFHQKFGLEYLGKPRSLHTEKNDGEDGTLFDFRTKFMLEELTEYMDEQPKLTEKVDKYDEGGVVKYLDLQLDALVDLMYVALGTAYLQFGKRIFYEAWRRVQAANMAKVRVENTEDSKRGSKFDVVKPKGWVPPTHVDLLEDHAHVIFRQGGALNPESARDTQVVREEKS